MIRINLEKARKIAHDIRRGVRDEQLEPLDKQTLIPSKAEQAEAERQKIRESNAEVQTLIDAAASVEDLKLLVEALR